MLDPPNFWNLEKQSKAMISQINDAVVQHHWYVTMHQKKSIPLAKEKKIWNR